MFKHSEGFAQNFVHYLFFDMGKVKLSMDKNPMPIYFFYKYQLFLFPHPWLCPYFVYRSSEGSDETVPACLSLLCTAMQYIS